MKPYVAGFFVVGLLIGIMFTNMLFGGDILPVLTVHVSLGAGGAGGDVDRVRDTSESLAGHKACVSFGDLANYTSFPYGPCNVHAGKRADHYCECKRPFKWVDVSTDNAPLTTEEKKGVGGGDTPRQCTLGRCCYGKLAKKWAAKECADFPMKRVELGRPLYTAQDALEALPDGTRLTFFGDAIMFQTYNAFLCSLARHGASLGEETKMPRKLSFYETGISSVQQISVRSGSQARGVQVTYMSEYRVNPSGLTIKEACAVSDVLVFDWGSHYLSAEDYQQAVAQVILPNLRRYCFDAGVQVVFRGSAAEHYLRPGGFYSRSPDPLVRQWMSRALNTSDVGHRAGCAPLHFSDEGHAAQYDWKNRLLVAEFLEQGFAVRLPPWGAAEFACSSAAARRRLLHYVPLGEITAELWQQHHLECAQYCSTPTLWQPVFDALYLFFAAGGASCRAGEFPPARAVKWMEPRVPHPAVVAPRYYLDELRNVSARVATKIYKN